MTGLPWSEDVKSGLLGTLWCYFGSLALLDFWMALRRFDVSALWLGASQQIFNNNDNSDANYTNSGLKLDLMTGHLLIP